MRLHLCVHKRLIDHSTAEPGPGQGPPVTVDVLKVFLLAVGLVLGRAILWRGLGRVAHAFDLVCITNAGGCPILRALCEGWVAS